MERIHFVSNNIKVLNKLCLELDPYQPITEEQKLILKDFDIHDYYDPFKVTNNLLILLEDSIEELHQLEAKSKIIQ